jgi:LCP family protein required for cell wall assembly
LVLFVSLVIGVNAACLEDLGSVSLPDLGDVIVALRSTFTGALPSAPLEEPSASPQSVAPVADHRDNLTTLPDNSSAQAYDSPITSNAQSTPSATSVPNTDSNNAPVLARPTNILLLGTDVVYSKSNKRNIANKVSLRGNSDSIMLIHSDPFRKSVAILQIPRDTEVSISGYGTRKINAANPIGGPALAKQTVSQLVGLPIDRYAIMNIGGLVDLVNELGGVTVQVPKRMHYIDWTAKLNIDLQPGPHTLTGNQAMGFVRFRNDGGGDIGRIRRQQIFLNAFVLKALTPSNWSHLPALFTIAQRNINTDIRSDEFLQCIYFLRSLPKGSVRIAMLPGRASPNGNWIVDRDTVRTFVDKLTNNTYNRQMAGESITESTDF